MQQINESRIEFGDCRDIMRRWAAQGIKAQTCVTSPPYYHLRNYGVDGQLGLESSLDDYIANMVEVFRCVRDVLADDGTLWVNMGDSYNTSNAGNRNGIGTAYGHEIGKPGNDRPCRVATGIKRQLNDGLKAKDLIGVPWMLAFALRADGWFLRQDIIWQKPNPMPESVTDRCTKAHEYIFLLSKSGRYFFDHEAIKEPALTAGKAIKSADGWDTGPGAHGAFHRDGREQGKHSGAIQSDTRNRRSVWSVATRPYKGAHFATFPPALIEPCILAGARPGDFVLDPFMGSGTTAAVAIQHGRRYLGCELNREYKSLQDERIGASIPVSNSQLNLLVPAA